jgi:hypothetical protein
MVAISYALLWMVAGGVGVVRFGLPAFPVSISVVAVLLISVAVAVYKPARLDWEKSKAIARAEEGLCWRCGYDLTGNVSGVCPECGTRTCDSR